MDKETIKKRLAIADLILLIEVSISDDNLDAIGKSLVFAVNAMNQGCNYNWRERLNESLPEMYRRLKNAESIFDN